MTARVSDRIAAIAESATLAVDAKAKALKAAGRPVIGFGAGEPDFPTPEHIVEAAVRACRDPRHHRYSPAAGLPELREAIAAKTLRDSGFACTADQVLVTNGGKHAVFTAFAALCDPGDEVICPAPFWTTYPEAITLAGGVPVIVETGAGEAAAFPDAAYVEAGATVAKDAKSAIAKADVLFCLDFNRTDRVCIKTQRSCCCHSRIQLA